MRIHLGKAISLLLLVAVLVAGLAQTQAARAQTCAKNYTVVSGDTISGIADANKVTVQELAAANNLKEPYTIYVGQVLCIPGTPTTTTTGTTTTKSTKPSFTVERTALSIVTVSISNYPGRTIYWVKVVGEGNTYKIGRVRTDKAGSANAVFRLPRALFWSDDFTVCLKNPLSNGVLCKYPVPPSE
jgi:hypothetical protein